MHGQTLAAVSLGTGRTARRRVACLTVRALADATVKCWATALLQARLRDTADRGDAPNELGDHLPAVDFGAGQSVARLVSGWHHNCVVLSGGGGAVRCWGNGEQGALGLENNLTRGDAPGEMGAALMSINLSLGEP